MQINRSLLLLSICLFLFMLLPAHLYAGLKVDPTVLEIVVDKDSPAEKYFAVSNTGKIPLQVGIELKKKNKKDIETSNWFKIDQKKIELKPGEKIKVPCKIILPKDAEGELRGMLYFIADELGKQKSFIGIRFGVPIYAIVQNTAKLAAVVDKIDVKYKPDLGILKGIVYVKNKSNIHIRPDVVLSVYDSNGKKVKTFEIPFGQPAQVGQNRPFRFEKKLKLDPGKYELRAVVDYGKMYDKQKLIAEGAVTFEAGKDVKKQRIKELKN